MGQDERLSPEAAFFGNWILPMSFLNVQLYIFVPQTVDQGVQHEDDHGVKDRHDLVLLWG